jgi:hypothetical protein
MKFKEACRLFYMVKGHLNVTDATIMDSADGYFKRLWNNIERSEYATEGFEEAYKKRLDNAQ